MFARSRSFDHLVRELLGKCGGDACAARARRFDPSLRFELFIDKHDRLAINAHGHGEFAAAGQKSAGSEAPARSEEQTSELQSLMRISYAVFCLQKKTEQR